MKLGICDPVSRENAKIGASLDIMRSVQDQGDSAKEDLQLQALDAVHVMRKNVKEFTSIKAQLSSIIANRSDFV